ncbi:MAG: molecular chaperone TorD family protein [Coriobacteriia bacterium]|nr:molecular chaperone TorD family protein [Coriobacteriia bacterium]
MDDYLAARRYLYTLFQSLFGNEPNSKQLEAIDVGLTEQAFTVVTERAREQYEEAGQLARFLSVLSNLPELSELISEYTKTLIGPDKLAAPPWESVYTSKGRALFTHNTLEVRNLYRSQGFIAAKYPHVADDHLAIELDFLAQLAERAQKELAEEGDTALRASLGFLNNHLLEWLPLYTMKITEAAISSSPGFFTATAQALLVFAQADAKVLKELVD